MDKEIRDQERTVASLKLYKDAADRDYEEAVKELRRLQSKAQPYKKGEAEDFIRAIMPLVNPWNVHPENPVGEVLDRLRRGNRPMDLD